MEKRRATIRDVANCSGVSIATVSRVINNLGTVSNSNRERVLKAIDELHYFSNATASNLKRNKSRTIGIVIPNVTNEYFMEMVKGIEDSFQNDEILYIASSDDNSEKEHSILKKMMENAIEAVVIATTGFNDLYIKELLNMGLKIISVDRRIEVVPEIHFIGEDNYQIAYKMTKTFLQKYKGPLALFGGLKEVSVGKDRFKGASDAIAETGRSFFYYDGDFSELGAKKAFKQVRRHFPTGCGIITLNNAMTCGVIKDIYKDESLKSKYLIASYGQIQFQELFKESIALYVQQDPYRLGREAAKAIQLIKNSNYFDQKIEVMKDAELKENLT